MRRNLCGLILASLLGLGCLLGTGAGSAKAQLFIGTPNFTLGVGGVPAYPVYPPYPYPAYPAYGVYPSYAYGGVAVVAPRPYPYYYGRGYYPGYRPYYGHRGYRR
jgi:hypothetical protein